MIIPRYSYAINALLSTLVSANAIILLHLSQDSLAVGGRGMRAQ